MCRSRTDVTTLFVLSNPLQIADYCLAAMLVLGMLGAAAAEDQVPGSAGIAPQRTNGSIPSIFGGEIGTGMRRVIIRDADGQAFAYAYFESRAGARLHTCSPATRPGGSPPTSPSY